MDYSSVLQLIEDVNKQVAQFEEMKKSLEKKQKSIEEKERNFTKLAEEAAGALKSVADILKPNTKLRLQIEEVTSAFKLLAGKQPEVENFQTNVDHISQTVEIPLNENDNCASQTSPETADIEEKAEVIICAADSTAPKPSDKELVVKAAFPEAKQVALAADSWNWSPKPMERTEDAWETTIPSGEGIQFKFIVDGEWKCSDSYPHVQNNGVVNNCIGCK